MKYVVTINGKDYEVEVEKGQATVVKTAECATTVVKQTEAVATKEATRAEVAKPVQSNASGEPLKAPMPGIILDIKTTVGTTVKRGDVLFILEAMKMENEITAPGDGVVAEIVINKGAAVSTGDILAVIQ